MTNEHTENQSLKHIISEIWWMARRYADGRSSYATSTYNDAIRSAQRLGVDLSKGTQYIVDGTPWARDGQGPHFGGLTQEEYDMGQPIDEWSKAIPIEELKAEREKVANLQAQALEQAALINILMPLRAKHFESECLTCRMVIPASINA